MQRVSTWSSSLLFAHPVITHFLWVWSSDVHLKRERKGEKERDRFFLPIYFDCFSSKKKEFASTGRNIQTQTKHTNTFHVFSQSDDLVEFTLRDGTM